ncbi:hypothetical protein ABK040_014439 [Willaertia magna]
MSKKYKSISNKLPPQIQALFTPGPPIAYLPPLEKKRKIQHPINEGIANYIDKFEQEDVQYDAEGNKIRETKYQMPESRRKRKDRIQKENQEQLEKDLRLKLADWDPHSDPKATSEPFNTLFIAKMNYETTEETLRKHFEVYGPIKTVRVVKDITNNDKPRGYAFIEYESHEDMKKAYRLGDGMEIDGWRVLVDVERGRTVRDWKPRRLGGGLGNSREAPPEVVEEQKPAPEVEKPRGGRPFERRGGSGGGGGIVEVVVEGILMIEMIDILIEIEEEGIEIMIIDRFYNFLFKCI